MVFLSLIGARHNHIAATPFEMKPSPWALLALTSVASSAYVPESTLSTDILAISSLAKLAATLADGTLVDLLAGEGVSQDCNLLEVGIRRE